MNSPNLKRVTLLVRFAVCVLILAIGMGASRFLASRKKPPVVREAEERTLLVSGVVAEPGAHDVPVRGFGELRVVNSVSITPQVSGVVTGIHETLEEGQTVPVGDVLFSLDDREFGARRDEALAGVEIQTETISRLETQSQLDATRLEKLKRNHELAYAEWRRSDALFKEQQVGTQAGVEASERAYVQAFDQSAMLESAVRLFPARIREAKSNLKVLKARSRLVALDLERCVVKAPIRGRVTQVDVELGQLVGPSRSVISLADDSMLELHVPLDSRDVQQRLQLDTGATDAASPTTCLVQWTEAAGANAWTGRLDRIVRFDATTRTMIVAVRLYPESAASQTSTPPREGMFCRVDIPAAPMRNTFKLPRSAVNFEGEAYIAVSNRLRTVNVDVVRIDGDDVYVGGGLEPGTKVITTRLINPLEGTRLEWGDSLR